ncbi:MAG: hypothetical protein A2X82_20165 [Geobacteraceae bacterium GWC2_55_20]|nr:MAG: hypothetical protein A2X82_20165 [Geobacteraceae bacterium GWC2_55_20]OGU24449.1 MAG: hypothetical protein A2X85_09405 [Geobacteraceae bacterium GWF2_54_21]HCE68390.1 hypothetical protein [Geobacter sp.]
MQRNRTQKIFDTWRKENRHRFTYPMYLNGNRRHGRYRLSFAGITPEIRLHLVPSNFGVWAYVKTGRSGGDGLVEFDVLEERHPVTRKYYCGFCTEPIYYDTRSELWIKHSFEPLLEWMNENFQPGKWLCLYGTDEWIHSVKILNESEMLQHRDNLEKYDFYCAMPVVKTKGGRVIVKKL